MFIFVLPQINPRDPLADIAENFIGDGADFSGPLFGADDIAVVAAEEGDGVSDPDVGDGGDIDHDPVHADRSGDRDTLSAHQHFAAVGELTAVTIGITDRNRGDQARPGGAVAMPVGDAGPGRDAFKQGDARTEAHHRLEVKAVGKETRRNRTIKGDAGTNDIALGDIAGKDRRAVAEVNITRSESGGADLVKKGTKCRNLLRGEGMRRIVGEGKVRKNPFKTKMAQGRQLRQDRGKLMRLEAEIGRAHV